MERTKIFSLIRMSYLLAFIFFYSCNSSSALFLKNDIMCYEGIENFEYEDIDFIKNNDFKKITKFIEKEYKGKTFRNVFYIKSKELYYCEFYVYDYSIECLLLDKNMKVGFYDRIDFDW